MPLKTARAKKDNNPIWTAKLLGHYNSTSWTLFFSYTENIKKKGGNSKPKAHQNCNQALTQAGVYQRKGFNRINEDLIRRQTPCI